jgi:hypothetical protein
MPKKSDILFEDRLTYKDVAVLSDAQQYVGDLLKDTGKKISLAVLSNATYSGYYLNGRVYPAKYMKAGTPTWTDAEHGGVSPYNAPVLKRHDDDSDPIGRVVWAEYHQIKQGADWVEDWKSPAMGLQKGSGYIRLTLNITDADEIPKFLDNRHKTLSTSAVSENLVCSICGQDVMKTRDYCGHTPGQEYTPLDEGPLAGRDSAMCYFITGPKKYKEVSVVWNPAQPHAVIDSIKVLSDSLKDGKSLDIAPYIANVDVAGDEFQLIVRDDLTGAVVPLTLKKGQPDAIPNGSMRPSGKVVIPVNMPDNEQTKTVVATEGSMDSLIKAVQDTTEGLSKVSERLGVIETRIDKLEASPTQDKETTQMPQDTPANKPADGSPNPGQPAESTQPDAKKADERTLDAMAAQLADLRENNKQLQSDRDAKEAELTKMTSENAGLKDQLHKEHCLRLALMRAVTAGKGEGKALDSMDAVKVFATELAKRAHVSIADSLKDEDSVFNAKLPHLKGLPHFISDVNKSEPDASTRIVDGSGKNNTSKTAEVDI